MSKILRFQGAISNDFGFGQLGLIHPNDVATLTQSLSQDQAWRYAYLPGEYELPLTLSLEVIRGNQDLAVPPVPGIEERPDDSSAEHIWIQIVPIEDYNRDLESEANGEIFSPSIGISISPLESATGLPFSADPDFRFPLPLPQTLNPFNLTMPAIARNSVSDTEFTKFHFTSPHPEEIEELFEKLAVTYIPGGKYKIVILAPGKGGTNRSPNNSGYDEYAFQNIRILYSPAGWTKQICQRDNEFVSRAIPASDLSYSWIQKSAERTITRDGDVVYHFSRNYETDNPFGEKIPFLSSSEVGSYTFDLSSDVHGTINFGRTFGVNFDTVASPAFNEHLESFLPTDFLGLNSHIVDPIDILQNTQGYDNLDATNQLGTERTIDVNYINDFLLSTHQTPEVLSAYPERAGIQEDTEGSVGLAAILNSIILNRQGPYGWPTFKQIRTGDHPIAKKQREQNLYSLHFRNGETLSVSDPVISTSSPVEILEVKNPRFSVLYKDEFLNRNASFASQRLVRKLYGDYRYLPGMPYGDYSYIKFSQRILPREVHVGERANRARDLSLFPSWRANYFYRQLPVNPVRYSPSGLRLPLSQSVTGDPIDPMSLPTQSIIKSGGHSSNSIWPLDNNLSYHLIPAGDTSTWSTPWNFHIPLYRDSHNLQSSSTIEAAEQEIFLEYDHIEVDELGNNPQEYRIYDNTKVDPIFTTGVLLNNRNLGFTVRKTITDITNFESTLGSWKDSLRMKLENSKVSYSHSIPIFKTNRDLIYGVDRDLYHKIEQSVEKEQNKLGPNRTSKFYRKLVAVPNSDPVRYIAGVWDPDSDNWLIEGDGTIFRKAVYDSLDRTRDDIVILNSGAASLDDATQTNPYYEYIYDTNGVLLVKNEHRNANTALALNQTDSTWIYVDEQGRSLDEPVESLNLTTDLYREDLSYARTYRFANLIEKDGAPAIDNSNFRRYYFANILAGNNQKWTAHLDHPIGGPNYNSYDEFMTDVRPLGKDYTVLPSFRIHNFIDEIITSGSTPKDVVNNSEKGFLEISGTLDEDLLPPTAQAEIEDIKYEKLQSPIGSISSNQVSEVIVSSSIDSKSDSSFYKTYSTTDLLKVFDLIEVNDLASESRVVKLKAKAIKKFLPLEGFYPVERSLDLATHFASSYYGSFRHLSGNDPEQAYVPWMQALLSPGILYNTIKSGLAVDYPIFSNSQYPVTPVSPYVVNYRQIGLSPTDYEYEVGPICFRGMPRTREDEHGHQRWTLPKSEGGQPISGKYDMYNLNQSPYKPVTGISFADPPAHTLGGDFRFAPSTLSNIIPKYSKVASDSYNLFENYIDPDISETQSYRDSLDNAGHGRIMPCGNLYSPYYYKKYYTELDVAEQDDQSRLGGQTITEYSGSFVSPVRYALGSIDSNYSFDYRIPFEAVIDPDLIVPGTTCHSSGGWHQDAYVSTTSAMLPANNDRYKMASNNFFAEIIDFFLPRGKLTTLFSRSDSDPAFGNVQLPKKDYEYRMRLILMKDPAELEGIEGEEKQDYLDVVTGLPVKYHTGSAYEYTPGESPNETFRSFVIDYFDKWSYNKGSSYQKIKDFHNLTDLEILGLSRKFHGSQRTFSFSEMFLEEYRKDGLTADQLALKVFAGSTDNPNDNLGLDNYDLKWLSDLEKPEMSSSRHKVYKGPFNIANAGDANEMINSAGFCGGFEFYIKQGDALGDHFEDDLYANGNESTGYGDGAYDYFMLTPERSLPIGHPAGPGIDNEIINSATQPVGRFLNNVRHVYIETDEAFTILPPTFSTGGVPSLQMLTENYSGLEMVLSEEEAGVLPSDISAYDAGQHQVANILSKAMSMKTESYLKTFKLLTGTVNNQRNHEGRVIRSIGGTIGNILDTNDIYSALYEHQPFNINLGYYFGKAGSMATTDVNRKADYSNRRFVLYNNKTSFGPPCVTLEGWNTIHFPQIPQNLLTNNTVYISPDRELSEAKNTPRDFITGTLLTDSLRWIEDIEVNITHCAWLRQNPDQVPLNGVLLENPYGLWTELFSQSPDDYARLLYLHFGDLLHRDQDANPFCKNLWYMPTTSMPGKIKLDQSIVVGTNANTGEEFSELFYDLDQDRLDFIGYSFNPLDFNSPNNNASLNAIVLWNECVKEHVGPFPNRSLMGFPVYSRDHYKASGITLNPTDIVPGFGIQNDITQSEYFNQYFISTDDALQTHARGYYRTSEWMLELLNRTITPETLSLGQFSSVTRGRTTDYNPTTTIVSRPYYPGQQSFFPDNKATFAYGYENIFLRAETEGLFDTYSLPPSDTGLLDFADLAADGNAPRKEFVRRSKARLPQTASEVLAHNNTLFDDHYYLGFMEPIVSYDFRPYTPPYYEGYCYAEYVFTPLRPGKHSLEEIFENTYVEYYRRRDKVKYANTLETEPYVPNYWHEQRVLSPVDPINDPLQSYKHYINPSVLRHKKVGAPNPEYVKMFPSLLDDWERDKSTGTDDLVQFAAAGNMVVPGMPVSLYRAMLASRTNSDPGDESYMPTKRPYGTQEDTDANLLSYLPNTLKTSQRSYIIYFNANDIISPSLTRFEFPTINGQVTPQFVQGEEVDLTSNFDIQFKTSFTRVVDNAAAFLRDSSTPIGAVHNSPLTIENSRKLPLRKVFKVGSTVSFMSVSYSNQRRAVIDGVAQMVDYEMEDFSVEIGDRTYDTSPDPSYNSMYPTEVQFFTADVIALDEATSRVTLATNLTEEMKFRHNPFNESRKTFSLLNTIYENAVPALVPAFKYWSDSIRFSSATKMTVHHPAHSEEFSSYGYIPRFCGLDYPNTGGFLVNESTWNRLNPMLPKQPLFIDRQDSHLRGIPLQWTSQPSLPNNGKYYDILTIIKEWRPSTSDKLWKNQSTGQARFTEKVVNWRTTPLLTSVNDPRFLGNKAFTTTLRLQDEAGTEIAQFNLRENTRGHVFSPTNQGATSFVFYRYNNRLTPRDSLNNNSEMQIDSSFNLFGMTNVEGLEFDNQGNLVTIKRDDSGGSRWVISPKMETPILNFSKWLERKNRHIVEITIPEFRNITTQNGFVEVTGEGADFEETLQVSLNIHGPAIGIEHFKVNAPLDNPSAGDLTTFWQALSATHFPNNRPNSTEIRATLASELASKIKTKLNSKSNYESHGGKNWLQFDEEYPDIDSIVSVDGPTVTLVGPPAEVEDYNSVKFKIVNARLSEYMENGYGTDEIGFLDVRVKQDAGAYLHADRIEPESYKRRDIDIVPDPIVGMWHQEGEIPKRTEGLCMTITDSPGEFTMRTPAEAVISIDASMFQPFEGFVLTDHTGHMETYQDFTSVAGDTITSEQDAAAFDGIKIESGANPLEPSVTSGPQTDGLSFGPVSIPNLTRIYAPFIWPGLASVQNSAMSSVFGSAADVAATIARQINRNSKRFTAYATGINVYILTNSTSARSNKSRVSVLKTGAVLDGIFVKPSDNIIIEKQFSGGGQSLAEYGSLADLTGFRKRALSPLGRIANSKRVKEAVIAIPIQTVEGIKSFVTLNRDTVNSILENREVEAPASLVRQLSKMKRYVLPPNLDFINDDDIDPYLAYVLEFEHTFTKQDLADIWQNLYPRDSAKVEVIGSEFSHDLRDFPEFDITSDVRWMVFKVKQKAEKNYFNKVSRSIKDLEDTMKDSSLDKISLVQQEPTYSYNWPYDYFSLVELFKMDAELDMTNGEIPTFEEYMRLASKIDTEQSKSPAELMDMVENATQTQQEDEAERLEALRLAAEKRREAQERFERLRSPRTEKRMIYRASAEGSPYIITSSGVRIFVRVDSEGNYYYMATRNENEEEVVARRGDKYAYKVTIIATGFSSEGR